MKEQLVNTLHKLCAIDGPIPEGTTGVSVPEEGYHPFYMHDSGTAVSAWVNEIWLPQSVPPLMLPLSLCKPHELMLFHRKGSYQCARRGRLLRALERRNNPIPEGATHVLYSNCTFTTYLRYTRHDCLLWQAASRKWEPVNRETISFTSMLPFTLLSKGELGNFRPSAEPKVDLYEAKLVERYLAEKWCQREFREEFNNPRAKEPEKQVVIKPSKARCKSDLLGRYLREQRARHGRFILGEAMDLQEEPASTLNESLLVEPTIKPSVKATFPANAMLTIDFPYHMGGSFGGGNDV